MLRTYLFADGDILEVEEEAEHGAEGSGGESSLGIGSLRDGASL
jgi:hypothetical protein